MTNKVAAGTVYSAPDEHCTIPWPNCDSVTFWPWNSTVLTDLDIYTGFIPTQLMTNTSGCCYSL